MTRIVPLTPSNTTQAEPLRTFWGYPEGAFERLIRHTDGCSVLALKDEEAVGLTLGFPWGEIGWIGGVATLKDHRGDGIGQAMVEATVDALRENGCATIKLYATPKAIPLYERIGFQGEAEYCVANGGQRAGRDPDVIPIIDRIEDVKRLDASIFPGDRGPWLGTLLHEHATTSIGVTDQDDELVGYGIARPGKTLTEIGPVIAEPDAGNQAQDLVDGLLTRIPEQPVELIHPKNGTLAQTAWSCRGFVTTDTPLEMRLGPPVREDRDAIVAAGGQEVG